MRRRALFEGLYENPQAGVIDALSLLGRHLTNKVVGMKSVERGWPSLAERRALSAAEPLGERADRLIIIKINPLYRPTMREAELYEATRKW